MGAPRNRSRVYFIKPVGMDGPIKIGCSQSPERRRRALATWSPFALEIIAEIDGGTDLERRFHALFQETHQRREWFGWSKRIAATIEAINAGTFDIATLPAPICVAVNPRSGKGSRAREWSPGRRFDIAYTARLRALRKRGMSYEEYAACPTFNAHGAYLGYGKGFRPNTAADIRNCEAIAAEKTAKYGHEKMKPVLWRGPMPDASTQEAA